MFQAFIHVVRFWRAVTTFSISVSSALLSSAPHVLVSRLARLLFGALNDRIDKSVSYRVKTVPFSSGYATYQLGNIVQVSNFCRLYSPHLYNGNTPVCLVAPLGRLSETMHVKPCVQLSHDRQYCRAKRLHTKALNCSHVYSLLSVCGSAMVQLI